MIVAGGCAEPACPFLARQVNEAVAAGMIVALFEHESGGEHLVEQRLDVIAGVEFHRDATNAGQRFGRGCLEGIPFTALNIEFQQLYRAETIDEFIEGDDGRGFAALARLSKLADSHRFDGRGSIYGSEG